MTDAQPTNVVSRVDELRKEAVSSRDAVRQQLQTTRAQRDTLAAKIKTLVAEEEKLSRIVRNLERMSEDGEVSAPE